MSILRQLLPTTLSAIFAPISATAAAPSQHPSASLPRRGAALVAGLLLFAAAGIGLQAWTLGLGLQAEQAARNTQAAQALARIFLTQPGDLAAAQALAQAQWALGHEDRIRWSKADGSVLLSLQRVSAEPEVPDWFIQAWPLDAPPGHTVLEASSQPASVLEVEASRAWAHHLLWQTLGRSALWMAGFAAVVSLLVAAMLRGWLLRWRLILEQLQGLAAGRLIHVEASGLPEVRRIHSAVRGLRQELQLQVDQVLRLQLQAQSDGMTGLALRHHFLRQMQSRLADPQGGRTALLIVRVCDLEALNLRAGRETTDRLLCAVAHVLLTYVDRVGGALAGRLNGGDFALCLPVGGVALETAVSLSVALSALPAIRSASAQTVVGGVDDLPRTTCSAALAEADAALARAEAGGGGVAVDRHGDLVADAAGASAWRTQIADALSDERGCLDEAELGDREGRCLRWACSLHLQLTPGAAHQPPRAWLALARRAQLLPRVDLLTLRLALQAIARDARPRGVRVSAAAWAAPGFVAAVKALLQSAPAQARELAIDLAEPERAADQAGLAAAVAAWLPCGVRLGVEQGSTQLLDLRALQAAGIASVTLSAAHWRGLGADEALKAYASSVMQLARDLGLAVWLAGPCNGQDLDALWALGLTGVMAPQTAAA
jgi:GGDEF domain-containing protein/EAL domain-containing protein (putative c-di-GMP-specific phosphodiesterase class I)